MLTDVLGKKKKHTKIDRRKKEWEKNKWKAGGKWEEEITKKEGKKRSVKEGEKKGRKKKSDR